VLLDTPGDPPLLDVLDVARPDDPLESPEDPPAPPSPVVGAASPPSFGPQAETQAAMTANAATPNVVLP
jgi:hypothetical protein